MNTFKKGEEQQLIIPHNQNIKPEGISDLVMYELFKLVTKLEPNKEFKSILDLKNRIYKPDENGEYIILSANKLLIQAPKTKSLWASTQPLNALGKTVARILSDVQPFEQRYSNHTRPKPKPFVLQPPETPIVEQVATNEASDATDSPHFETPTPTTGMEDSFDWVEQANKAAENDKVPDEVATTKKATNQDQPPVVTTEQNADAPDAQPPAIVQTTTVEKLPDFHEIVDFGPAQLQALIDKAEEEKQRKMNLEEVGRFANEQQAIGMFRPLNVSKTMLDRAALFTDGMMSNYGHLKKVYHPTKDVEDGVTQDGIIMYITVDNLKAGSPENFITSENLLDAVKMLLERRLPGATNAFSVSFGDARGVHQKQFYETAKAIVSLRQMTLKQRARDIIAYHKLKDHPQLILRNLDKSPDKS